LPPAARIDEDGVGAVEAAPVGHRVGRCPTVGRQTFETADHAVGVDGTFDIDG
jgi:hypothetical protein